VQSFVPARSRVVDPPPVLLLEAAPVYELQAVVVKSLAQVDTSAVIFISSARHENTSVPGNGRLLFPR